MPAPSTSSAPRPSPTSHSKPPQPTLYAFRISIAVGEPGDLKRRENVQLGVVLPNENKPMASFVGATENLSVANFVIADTVDDVKGGDCVPDSSSCSVLRLKPGQEAHLHYAPQNTRYNLKLIGIKLVPVQKVAKSSSPSSKSAGQAPVYGGGLAASRRLSRTGGSNNPLNATARR